MKDLKFAGFLLVLCVAVSVVPASSAVPLPRGIATVQGTAYLNGVPMTQGQIVAKANGVTVSSAMSGYVNESGYFYLILSAPSETDIVFYSGNLVAHEILILVGEPNPGLTGTIELNFTAS
jgi:hypothetical protein